MALEAIGPACAIIVMLLTLFLIVPALKSQAADMEVQLHRAARLLLDYYWAFVVITVAQTVAGFLGLQSIKRRSTRAIAAMVSFLLILAITAMPYVVLWSMIIRAIERVGGM